MRISDLLYETWSALAANKGRSLLTILGIVIGIAAVIAMTSLIGGVKQALVSELGLDQSRVVYIDYYSGEESKSEDLVAIEEGVDGYEFVTGMQYAGSKASTETKSSDVTVIGASKGFFQASGLNLAEGRLLSDTELSGDGMLAVVDSIFARALFGEDESPVGKTFYLGNTEFSVVGVVENTGIMGGGQGTVYIPYATCTIRVSNYYGFSQVIGYAKEDVDTEAVVADTEQFLRSYFNITEDDLNEGWSYIYVQSIASIQQELDSTMMAFQLLMTAVAGISLLVGGIGIMNMMLTNVTERIREIGLRKALGAHKGDITMQFLIESVALCLVGGIIGFALGVAGAWGISAVAGGALGEGLFGTDMAITPYISWSTVLTAIGICVGIGIVFGFWPARRAAKMDPVESLRYQ